MDVMDVANIFIHLAKGESEGCITNLKLNKLLYFVQGWSLVRFNKPIFNEDIQAWQHGPVVPSVYHTFSVCGAAPIENSKGNYSEECFSNDEMQLVLDVYREYGKYTAQALVDITHRPNTPWSRTYKPNVTNIVIPLTLIKEYFASLPEIPTFKLPDLSKYIIETEKTEKGSIILPKNDDWEVDDDI